MIPSRVFVVLLGLLAAVCARVSAAGTILTVQAESGTRGAEVNAATESGVTYVTAATDGAGDNPASTARVVTFPLTFPTAGTYDLFARVRVGVGNATDDSLFYGNGFGARSATDANDWITVNSLGGIGYTAGTDVVGAGGTAGVGTWKWIKLSAYNDSETGVQFVVPAGGLAQTFVLGMRENALDIDIIAFGLTGTDYTVTDFGTTSGGGFTPTGPPMATGKPKWLGGAHSGAQAANFTAYFNQLVPENAGKWGSVEGTRDVMNWTQLDTAYNLAKSNGFPFRFHILVWGNQQPAWIETLSTAEQLEEIDEWFAAVAARYPDIDYLEVVNEPLHDPPNMPGSGGGNYINALGGAGTTGWDWILNSFRKARQYFPNTPLVLNDYSIVNSTSSTQTYVSIINLLKAEDLIQVVAVQGHHFSTVGASNTTITNNLNTLAATGLPLMVTELDIDGANATTVDDQTQLAGYQRIFPLFWEHPSVIGVTLWGYRPGHWRPNAILALADGTERSAFQWLQSYVAASNPPLLVQISSAPANASSAGGEDATFTVAASGNPAPTFQWQRSTDDGATWSNVTDDATYSGATTATLIVASVSSTMNGDRFRAAATNGTNGTVNSAAATLTVTTINATVSLSNLTQTYTGTPLSPSATTTPAGLAVDLTFDGSVTVPTETGVYQVVATVNDPAYAGAASGTFTIAPLLVVPGPTAVTTTAGQRTTLTVNVPSGGTATYQWQMQAPGGGDWMDVPDAVGSTLFLWATQSFQAGNYRAVVTVNGASAASSAVAVGTTPATPSNARLLNLSTRALCQTGDGILIPGFVISGSGTKQLLIRAVGPTLSQDPFFVPGTLPDPRMTLKRLNTSVTPAVYVDVDSNDDWADNTNAAAITQTAIDLSAFAFQDAAEAALLVDLAAGQYTVFADDGNGATGVAIVELYDADPTNSTTRLVNISNRGFAGAGGEVMIPGFVVSSEGPKTFLIRAVGPTLANPPYNVPGTMTDPMLLVFDGGNNLILQQDNWGDSPDAANTATVAAAVSAFALDSGSADAAFVITLPPGGYTVHGRSANGSGNGVILVEIYVVQ